MHLQQSSIFTTQKTIELLTKDLQHVNTDSDDVPDTNKNTIHN